MMERIATKTPSDAADGSRFGTGDVADINRYIKLGPLGRTFAAADRHVLLIDEIDKADL